MSDGITVRILGDFGPFSKIGKSIGYQVGVGDSTYLIDCGSPLFQQIGDQGLKNINGLLITHCHDDHKRWFTDLALFSRYTPGFLDKITLITSEGIHSELIRMASPAMDRSLSLDSKTVIDIPYQDYIDAVTIGPHAKYRINAIDEGNAKTVLCITDRHGNMIGPEKAKIVISSKTKRPRMLFKDPVCGEWVEPEHFYPFSSEVFYETEQNIYHDPEGFSITAIKSPVWHGITAIGFKIESGNEKLIFSSDTVHDTKLWAVLCREKKTQRLSMSRREFELASVIYGDINDYIERTWSEERYTEALSTFNDAVVIHDVSSQNSVVHTDYEKLRTATFTRDRTLLTHGPDIITSEWALCDSGKTFRIRGRRFFEVVEDRSYPMNADIYHKENGRYFVGYRNDKGRHIVYEQDGMLGLSTGELQAGLVPFFRVDLYEDISGRYLPLLEGEDSLYFMRRDGKIELIIFNSEGSTGRIVEDHRGSLS